MRFENDRVSSSFFAVVQIMMRSVTTRPGREYHGSPARADSLVKERNRYALSSG